MHHVRVQIAKYSFLGQTEGVNTKADCEIFAHASALRLGPSGGRGAACRIVSRCVGVNTLQSTLVFTLSVNAKYTYFAICTHMRCRCEQYGMDSTAALSYCRGHLIANAILRLRVCYAFMRLVMPSMLSALRMHFPFLGAWVDAFCILRVWSMFFCILNGWGRCILHPSHPRTTSPHDDTTIIPKSIHNHTIVIA